MRRARGLLLVGMIAVMVPVTAHADGPGGNTFTPQADITVTTTATLLRARNGARINLVCTNTSATIHVRLGDSVTVNPPSATKGVQLRATSSISITAKSAVVAIAESTTAIVSCSEEVQ